MQTVKHVVEGQRQYDFLRTLLYEQHTRNVNQRNGYPVRHEINNTCVSTLYTKSHAD